jgi:hypothetical protein
MISDSIDVEKSDVKVPKGALELHPLRRTHGR